MEDYNSTMNRFKDSLKPDDGGDDLSAFVDELKLHVIGKTGIKALKKTYGDRYETMLTLFTDRCFSTGAQYLGGLLNNIFFEGLGHPKILIIFLKDLKLSFLLSGNLIGLPQSEIFDNLLGLANVRLNSIAMKVHNMAQAMSDQPTASKKRKGQASTVS